MSCLFDKQFLSFVSSLFLSFLLCRRSIVHMSESTDECIAVFVLAVVCFVSACVCVREKKELFVLDLDFWTRDEFFGFRLVLCSVFSMRSDYDDARKQFLCILFSSY